MGKHAPKKGTGFTCSDESEVDSVWLRLSAFMFQHPQHGFALGHGGIATGGVIFFSIEDVCNDDHQ